MKDDPDLGAWSYVYDVLGNLKATNDAASNTINQTYDLLDRLVTRNDGEFSTAWTWGAGPCKAHPASVVQTDIATGTQSHREEYGYDSLCRVIEHDETVDGLTHTTNTAYTGLGRLDTVTYPSTAALSNTAPTASAGATLYATVLSLCCEVTRQ